MSTGSDDTAAKLIAALAGEAEFIDAGSFSIDAEAARKKLANRQLADPDAWILLVVEAAELLGVERLEIRERPAGLRIRLLGHAATSLASAAELEQLFTWVYAELGELDPEQRRVGRARELLALAINAALARPVRSVALARITPEQATRLLLRPDAPGVVGAIEPGQHELELRFDASIDPEQTFVPRPELIVVAERCGWGAAPIEMFGRVVARQPTASATRGSQLIELDGAVIGRAELLVAPEPATIAIVSNGVLLERVHPSGWAAGFRAVVWAGFSRDLSLGAAIRDAQFDRQAHAVRDTHDRLVAEQRAQGRVVTPSKPVATTGGSKPAPLTAMIEGNAGVIGHTGFWAAIGLALWTLYFATATDSIVLTVAAGVGVLVSAGVAVYFLRMRKVFGDEG